MTETQSQSAQRDRTGDRTEADTADDATVGHAELTSRIGQLEAENRRLRQSVQDTHHEQYHGTARGLVAVGLLCGIAGVLTASDVLFALAGIGLFSGVLTYYLRPEQLLRADLSSRIYAASARSYDQLCADLGLSDRRLYVPVESADPEDAVRLFVPKNASMAPPTTTALQTNSLVVEAKSGTYGLSVHPTGGGLFAAFQTVANGPLDSDPQTAAQQLSDAVIEEFELARSVSTDADPEHTQLSVRFAEPLYDHRSGFDHPLVSFFAVGLAVALETPIEATVTDTEPLSVKFRWETERSPGEAVDGETAKKAASDTHDRSTARPSAGTK